MQTKTEIDFYSSTRHPYYIAAPAYRQTSAGVRALHHLCHILNETGYEAYVTTDETSPHLRAPLLTDAIRAQHGTANRLPIVIYPEVVPGNPLNGQVVARWLLNKPGHLGGDSTFPPSELLFFWDTWVLTEPLAAERLCFPIADTRIFNNRDNPFDKKREGFCYYAHKYIQFGGTVDPYLRENGISLCQDIPRTAVEIADILRRAKALYCYEPSTIVREAQACGCQIIYLSTPYLDTLNNAHGIEFCIREDQIRDTPIPEFDSPSFLRFVEEERIDALRIVDNFIAITQAAARKKSTLERKGEQIANQAQLAHHSTLDDAYFRWQQSRSFISGDTAILENAIARLNPAPTIHLFLRLQRGNETLLADTLDSLIQQFYGEWHLDIITPLPSPGGLDELPCVGWHTLGSPDEMKETIDFLAGARKFDWLLEIPAGARLDPLCLWRLAVQATAATEACAFFVDDDCCDSVGQHHSPRFKPGSNPGALQSADLAGPICISHAAWLATGGASPRHGSPWFFQLLRVAKQFGWDSILHIPDLLISYPGAFPSDPESCLLGLLENFKDRGIDGEIVPAGGQSWGIRYPLSTPPKVSIAIISWGQIDLLSRCLDSIVNKTAYPDFEIIITLGTADNDPDLKLWLSAIKQRPSPRIGIISTAGSYAASCNAAVDASAGDFVVLIREEAVVIQANWLEELVRTCQQTQVAGASPRQITPGDGLIQNAGNVLGLNGIVGSPYQGQAKLGETGYLDCLQVARDVSALPASCMVIRKAAYLAAGGMDETELGDYFAEADLCQKMRRNNLRLIYQPLATVVYGGSAELTIAGDAEQKSRRELAEFHAARNFLARWGANATVDPYWNPNLSLAETIPTLETDFRPQWQYLPSAAPRILARPLTNGQGIFRVTSPLRALRKAGLASECVWNQDGPREPSTAELLRLAPDTVIVQHYLHDRFLAALQAWNESPNRPFVVYALDDLLTDMAESNPFRKNVPANSRARLKFALERCDRLVASTEFLAETYRHFIPDIKVVPNRLEQEIWLPLQSRKRTGSRPRIGWAGGTTHQGDLQLLKEVIKQTRAEADWVFFGMCPDEIRPLLAEFHPFANFADYPTRLAALNLDIGVAPLAQIPFNQGKSNLRLLEYGVLSIPVVCTDIDPYRGSPACCVANTADNWIAALRERIHDADAREREGNALRQWVQHGYLLENHLDEWLGAHLPDRN